MGRVEKVEKAVQELSFDELAEFRDWFAEYDWVAWDQQLERDIKAGKLDRLAEEALGERPDAGRAPGGRARTRPLRAELSPRSFPLRRRLAPSCSRDRTAQDGERPLRSRPSRAAGP